MRSYLPFIFSLITCLFCPVSNANDAIISLYDQIAGPAWITEELRLESNGDVVEEKYNWNSKNFHSVTTLRNIEKYKVDSFLLAVRKHVESLPRFVDKDRPTPVDGEFKYISFGIGDKIVKTTWYSYNDAPSSEENQRFKEAWSVLQAFLLGKEPNK